ncbi:MAG: DUF4249 domain-containing protein [Bacteroidales bacterium]|nr:DUF4249 domain-containing protein [Bacteroidales bacterium]
MKNILLAALATLFILCSCEKEIDLNMPAFTPSVVVEGFIVNDMAPIVILTNNVEFVALAGKDLYEQSFIHNAVITIDVPGSTTDTLAEITQTNETTGLKSSFYTSSKTQGVVGKSYTLKVVTGGKTYSSVATIPEPVRIQEIWYENHPDAANDSFKTVWVKISDPEVTNYYRYSSEVNGQHGFQPEISTVSDKGFNGKDYQKAVDSGLKNEEQDMHGGVSGYYVIGDTVTVKWANAEKSYYDAWATIDFKRSQNQNPFMNPTRIVGNIKGCLGYWSGLGVDVKSIVLK